jgi:hypothetical protein
MVDYAELERRYGLPQGFLVPTRKVESAGGRNVYNSKSGAAGDFQFIPRTARAYGLTNPYDPAASADAAARLGRDNMSALRRGGIENPSAADLYLAHQQGASGALRLLRGGDTSAQSIVGANAVNWNSGNQSMTGPQFADSVRGKFLAAAGGGSQQSAPSSGAFARPTAVPSSVAFAQPTAVPPAATSSGAPVYSSDVKTTFQQLGNAVAPGWVDAPTQLTPEQAAAQKTADAATTKQYGGVASGLAGLAALFGQQQQQSPQEQMLRNDIVRGQFRPIQGMRGLL